MSHQVALEGEISKEMVQSQLSRGQAASGDLIPWTMSQQFQDNEFASLSGARVVRIATHPEAVGMGYGTRALELLIKYFQGELRSLDADDDSDDDDDDDADADGNEGSDASEGDDDDAEGGAGSSKHKLKPRKKLPPLLTALPDRKPERLHWLGVSFGLSSQLFRFWRK